MKTLCRIVAIIALAGASLQAVSAADAQRSRAAASARDRGNSADIVPGVVVVKFRRGSTPDGGYLFGGAPATDRLRAAGVSSAKRIFPAERAVTDAQASTGRIDLSTLYLVTIDPTANPVVIAGRLSALAEVEYAEPKFLSHPFDLPNDSLYLSAQAVYFSLMHAPEGWSLTKGDPTVVIGDVDGGTFWLHPDIQPNLRVSPLEDVNHSSRFEHGAPPAGDENGIDDDGNGYIDDVIGWNFGNSSNDPRGLFPVFKEHGTETASVIGAATNNGSGIAGAAWSCRVLPICASSAVEDNDLTFGFEGIHYASLNGAAVINCSWGRQGLYSQFEQDVITAATQAGALVVAAGGNSNTDNDEMPFYPASYAHVLAVGATMNTSDAKASFSNYGVTIPVYAPGFNIWVATATGSYTASSGTSFSAPLVSALAGLVKSIHPSWTPAQIAAQIRRTADSIDGVNASLAGVIGRGRVNYARALSESHAGLEVVDATLQTPSGGNVFLPGDTVVLRLRFRNELQPASNITVTAVPSNSSLRTLQGVATASAIGANAEATLPDFLFVVDALSSVRLVTIKVAWVSNGNDRDAAGFRLYLFPSQPSWVLQQSPLITSLFSVKAVDTGVCWTSGGDGLGTAPSVERTVDGGATWTDATGNLTGADLYCITAFDALHAWVGTGDGRIFATTDGGTYWAAQSYSGTQSPFIDGIWFFDQSHGVALGDPGQIGPYVLLRTTDGGSTWTRMATAPVPSSGEAGWNNSFWWTDDQHGWFGSNVGKMYRTTNGGASWTASSSGALKSVAVAFGDALHGIAGHNDGTLSVTVNGGNTWAPVATNFSGGVLSTAFVPGSASAWISTPSNVYRSTDYGSSWAAQLVYPVLGQVVDVSFADTSRGWGVTSLGEFLRYNPPIGTTTPVAPLPVTFQVYQNYPNPFNGFTTIRYELPARSRVVIRLYDILGRLVRTLYSGVQEPGSPVPVEVNAAGLASGAYIYRVSADALGPAGQSFSSSRKMILIR